MKAPVMSDGRANIYELDRDALIAVLRELDQPPFRARQIYRQLYVNLAGEFAAMTDLSRSLREELACRFTVGDLELVGEQLGDEGLTRKALYRLPQGEQIESVLMVYPDRATVCVSSQAGCPMGCVFCATGRLGLLRNLTRGQMVEQVLRAARTVRAMAAARPGDRLPARLDNVVFMGMGEPFNNYDAWWAAVERLHDPDGFNLGARAMTVSTVGLVPGIRRLAGERLPINLAVSLHAADDQLRSALMPVNKAFLIPMLLEAVRDYAEQTRRRVSFEYVLLAETNDEPAHAEALAALLRDGPLRSLRQLVHVNLIPWNPVPGAPLTRSTRGRVLAFQAVLAGRGVPCTVRVERGVDIAAACGQLAGGAGSP